LQCKDRNKHDDYNDNSYVFLLAGTEDSSTVTGQRDVTSLDTRRLATTINEVDDCCHSKDDRIATVKQVVRG